MLSRKKREKCFTVQSYRIIGVKKVFRITGAINYQRNAALDVFNLHSETEEYRLA
jgi:hypothetical protein